MIEYWRVSTQDQADSGLGLAAQRRVTGAAITMHEPQGWTSVAQIEDPAVTTRLPMDQRPGLARAMALIDAGMADGIVAAKLDRFARSAV